MVSVCMPAVCIAICSTELESGTRKYVTVKKENNRIFFLSVFSVPTYNIK